LLSGETRTDQFFGHRVLLLLVFLELLIRFIYSWAAGRVGPDSAAQLPTTWSDCFRLILMRTLLFEYLRVGSAASQIDSHERDVADEVEAFELMNRLDAIHLLLSAAAKFVDLDDVEIFC
jgi:hypothetical protein